MKANYIYKRKDGGTTHCYGYVEETSNFSLVCENEYNDGIVADEMVTDTNQASEDELRTLDDILSQAFTDGASDTMWQNDKHVEIFATAKKELLALIRTEKLKLLDALEAKAQEYVVIGEQLRGFPYFITVDNIKAERNKLEAEL